MKQHIRNWSIYIAGFILVFGVGIRLTHLIYIDMNFPFRGGGLFLEFARQIIASNYAMPTTIPYYTESGVPFAYPPLPFYVAASLIDLFNIPSFMVVNILPAVATALTVPAFYWLTGELRLTPSARIVALLVYSTMPVAFWELLEGSGLAEAFGALALICFLAALARAINRSTFASHLLAAVCWAFCITAGPGSAYASIPTFLLFVGYSIVTHWPPERWRIVLLVVMSLVAALLSAPYWVTVLQRYGTSFFVEAVHAQQASRGIHKSIMIFLFQFNLMAAFWYRAAIASGFIWTIASGRWTLWMWFVVIAVIPREGTWLVSIPASLIAGIGLADWIGPTALTQARRMLPGWKSWIVVTGATLFAMVVAMYTPIRAVRELIYTQQNITAQTIEATSWASANTPTDAPFIIFVRDYVDDWAPYLLQRSVLNVFQGTEWEPAEFKRWEELHKRLSDCGNYVCVQNQLSEVIGYHEVFIFADRSEFADHLGPPTAQSREVSLVILWENEESLIGFLSEGD